MQTQKVDRTVEKLALAREFGMRTYVYRREAAAKEIAEITALEFPHVTNARLQECLVKWYWAGSEKIEPFAWGCILGVAVPVAFLIGLLTHTIWQGAFIASALFTGGSLICFACCFAKTQIKCVALQDWTDELPYGALLAVKEAKEKGFGDFRIYYPAKEERQTRYVADPIITGRKENQSVWAEIFAWDDSKIYE